MKGHRWFAALYDLASSADEGVLGPIRRRLLVDVRGRVLELGVGTGFNFAYYPGDTMLIATEPDPYMLRRAVRRAQAQAEQSGRNPAIHLVQATAEALPFRSAVFDAAVATVVL